MITLSFESRTVTIRNPNFGNKETVEVRRINRKSRGGDIIVYRHTDWPKTVILTYAFTYLKESEQVLLMEFIKATLGQEITLVDYEGRTWLGIIITPAGDISDTAVEDGGAGFQFQGVIV